MHKKLAAALTIAIFVLSTFAIMVPAQAHFTLGDLTGTYRYHANDFDPHVAGPIGYVWPGGGLNSYSGFSGVASAALPPGYQSPWPGFNPPGAPSQSWYQLEANTYAPFGAVLTGSTGDLVFGLNATCTPGLWTVGNEAACSTQFDPAGNGVTKAELQDTGLTDGLGWDTWMILIPPEFTVPGAAGLDNSQMLSTITNDGAKQFVAKLSPYDRYAPNYTVVAFTIDAAQTPYYNHQYIEFTTAGEWYYARINGVTAPTTAGRYVFKMFLYSSNNRYGVGPTLGATGGGADSFENPGVWVPPQNWPVMLVKGEVDPAIVTGTLRYGGFNATLYGQPIGEAGLVTATMTTRIDPYTGQQRPDLPAINARGYVNATANGHYEVEGVAPGVYDLWASAAGYPRTLCASGVTVLKGQSLHFDCYLQPGPVIHGNVYTKHQFGEEPWPLDVNGLGQYIKIELYDAPTVNHHPDPSAQLVSWSPLPCVAGGQERYYGRRDAAYCGDPHNGGAVAFPWHEYSTNFNVVDPVTLVAAPGLGNGYSRDVAIGNGVSFAAPLGNTLLASDPQGVGPPQHWFVSGGTTTPFHFEFGIKGEYGAPRDLDGEVPQVYATWVNGLTAGRYYVRAWIFRYVQSALDGSTFQEYWFDVTPNEWAGDVTLPIDLRLSSWINKTVYFHNTLNTIVTGPITTGAGFIWGNLRGADGSIYAYNVTNLGYDDEYYSCGYNSLGYGQADANGEPFNDYTSSATGVVYHGSGEKGAPSAVCPGNANQLNRAHYNADSLASGHANFQFWGFNDTWGGVNYGIPSGTYSPEMWVNGYYEPNVAPNLIQSVSVTLSGNPTTISDHMFRAPGFNVTVTSIDFERPRISRPWVWGECQTGTQDLCLGSEIDVGFYPVINGTAGGLFGSPSGDYIGDETTFLPPSIGCFGNSYSSLGCTGLYQGDVDEGAIPCNPAISDPPGNSDCTEMDGGGRNVLAAPFGQGAHSVFFGQSGRYALVGGYTSGSFGWLRAPRLWRHQMFDSAITVLPSHFEEGPYNLRAYTYGYVQDKDFTAFAQNGQIADMKINLLIGVNISLSILFKQESIITGTPANMSGRVRIFNDKGELVADWMSSEGTYVTGTGVSAQGPLGAVAHGADGSLIGACDAPNAANACSGGEAEVPVYPFIDQGTDAGFGAPMQPASGLNPYNYIPGGVKELDLLLAGLPQQPPFGNFEYTGVYYGDPVFTPSSCDFEIDCYPGNYGQYPFPDSGILGAPDYTGGWTAEVDFVNWYRNNSGAPEPFNPLQTQSGNQFGQYYPPVQGLLMGESYHIIPGTTATSGISFTEDNALGPNFVGHSLVANHLGPYSQQGVWLISNAHNSGEASAVFEVDLNGLISGNVLAFTWSNEFRPLSWGLVNVVGASGASWNFYTYDGYYEFYLPPGSYTMTISSPGYASQTFSIAVSPGQSGGAQNVYLEQTNIPVPEFSTIAVVAFSALAASMYLLRRRRR